MSAEDAAGEALGNTALGESHSVKPYQLRAHQAA
jgi:hypothetical protein